MIKIIICGGRNFEDKKFLDDKMNFLLNKFKNIIIATGGASGADRLAEQWADSNSIRYETYKANWDKYKKMAGPYRNIRMLFRFKPHLVCAFKGGRGTKHMIRISEISSTPVYKFFNDKIQSNNVMDYLDESI